jgi:amino-acid N-acetyltransferase
MMIQRNARITDLGEIEKLLNDCDLLSVDVEEHLDDFFVYKEEGRIIGVGGLEKRGVDGLVRSIAVNPSNQNKGVGESIYKSIELQAYRSGINTLYLLTESAVKYFIKYGFMVKERSGAPESIMNTKQYKTLCPSTAKLMFKRIRVSEGNK